MLSPFFKQSKEPWSSVTGLLYPFRHANNIGVLPGTSCRAPCMAPPTKSHHYMNCIIGPQTQILCLGCLQQPESRFCTLPTGSVAQVYGAGLSRERVFRMRVSQHHWWSDLLLAVMVAAGSERCSQTLVRDQQEPETSLQYERLSATT